MSDCSTCGGTVPVTPTRWSSGWFTCCSPNARAASDLVGEARAGLAEDVGQRRGALLRGGEDVLDVDDRHRGRDGPDVPDRALRHADGPLDGALLGRGRQTGLVALHEQGPAEEREAEGLRGSALGRDGLAVRGREAAEVRRLRWWPASRARPPRPRQPSPARWASAGRRRTRRTAGPAPRPPTCATTSSIRPSCRVRGSPRGGYPKGDAGNPSRGLCLPTFWARTRHAGARGRPGARGRWRSRRSAVHTRCGEDLHVARS